MSLCWDETLQSTSRNYQDDAKIKPYRDKIKPNSKNPL
jgi:hypothetical protein